MPLQLMYCTVNVSTVAFLVDPLAALVSAKAERAIVTARSSRRDLLRLSPGTGTL
jgi:hypothetical protein